MMKKRCLLCGLILLLLLTACTTTKENPKKQTGEETAESLEKTDASFEAADKRSGQESLAGETEMNMSYPARFHEEIRILRAEDRLQMKKYEIPQEYGDKILKCGGPLTRGIVRADLYRPAFRFRWLVGSSRKRISAPATSTRASLARSRQPPLSSPKVREKAAGAKPRPDRMAWARCSGL